jgi:hypothetical protein
VLGHGQGKQRHHKRPQPNGLALIEVLQVVPAAVPVAVVASNTAAALAVIYEAAAAAELPADVVSVWSVEAGRVDGWDWRAADSRMSGCGANSSRQTTWGVILLSAKGEQVVAEALALLDLLQAAGCNKQAGQAEGQQGIGADRIWLAAPHELMETITEAAGQTCFTFSCDDDHPVPGGGLHDPALAATMMSLMLQAHAASCSAATAAAAGTLLPFKSHTSSSYTTTDSDSPSRSLPQGSLLAVLQPLMVAVTAAYSVIRWRTTCCCHNLPVACSLRGSWWDLLHLQVLLHNVARAALAAAEGSTSESSRGQKTSGSQLLLPCKPMPHGTLLSLDLEQLQKMLQWAVFDPASCKEDGASSEALGSALSPACLAVRPRGVRTLQSTEGGVMVQGGHIAEALEDVQQQQQESGDTCLSQAFAYGKSDFWGDGQQLQQGLLLSHVNEDLLSSSGLASTTIDLLRVDRDNGGSSADALSLPGVVCWMPVGLGLTASQLWQLLRVRSP